jgi:hypothetical protein
MWNVEFFIGRHRRNVPARKKIQPPRRQEAPRVAMKGGHSLRHAQYDPWLKEYFFTTDHTDDTEIGNPSNNNSDGALRAVLLLLSP